MKNTFFAKVFMWLFIGLLITFVTGYAALTSEAIIRFLFEGIGYIIVFVAQIALCIYWTTRLHKMSTSTAKICYIGYSVLTGLTFASIFMLFKLESIIFVLLATAILLGVFAVIGYFTKIDLTKIGTFLIIGLFATILLEIVNIFLMNNSLDITLCIFSVIVFLGYIAYDVQLIKNNLSYGLNDDKYAIFGAFELYLDFVNIFLNLLRLFGQERD